jgi:hypothetical protein
MSTGAAGKIRTAATLARVDLANHAAAFGDAATQDQFVQAFTADVAAFSVALEEYRKSGPAGDVTVVDDLQAKWVEYVQIAQTVQLPNATKGDLAAWQEVRTGKVAGVRDDQQGPGHPGAVGGGRGGGLGEGGA